jgi:predicted ATPase
VLATSREGLGLEGERIIPLAPLPLAGGDDHFETVSGSEAVRLFVQRAAQARDGFTLTPANAGVVSRLCRRLDGIPLAIELAAARVRSMTPGDILEHLDDRFRLLAAGQRSAPGRQQTLRATMDWSYDLLDEKERTVLRRLGVFAGGFDLSAAEAVAAGGGVDRFDVADALDRLVDKSLVVAETDAEHSRYRLLETIRDYAWARLDQAGEADDVSRRHAEFFATVATEAGWGLTGPEEGRWADVVDRELDNLRSALAWSVASAHVDLAMQLVAGLSVFSNGVVAPFRQLAGQIAALPATEGHRLRPLLLASAAYAVPACDGDMKEALALIEAAIAAVRSYGPAEWWVRCRVFSGAVLVWADSTGQRKKLGELL